MVTQTALAPSPYAQPSRTAFPDQARPATRHHVVHAGEDFSSISRDYYGSPRFSRALWWVNRKSVAWPGALVAGTRIIIPPIEQFEGARLGPGQIGRQRSILRSNRQARTGLWRDCATSGRRPAQLPSRIKNSQHPRRVRHRAAAPFTWSSRTRLCAVSLETAWATRVGFRRSPSSIKTCWLTVGFLRVCGCCCRPTLDQPHHGGNSHCPSSCT